nr:immunoglobulin light chain junction region [Macaca mulatta]MOV96365.1 immunoglobulin light chain junction region [Macaca mulatta]MOV98388.1 immunoglobulin light chain junction region [Macaca mulatta]MOV99882.1 immunoglobulin light chain junction region [Macaca mulatta]MOV99930.1 immunoglobulin light chain junction region [Macaca mulatta]
DYYCQVWDSTTDVLF